MKKRVRRHVETTIASLPAEVQADWADEMRADFEKEIAATPLSAVRWAYDLRRNVPQLATESAQIVTTPSGAPTRPQRRFALKSVIQRVVRALTALRRGPKALTPSTPRPTPGLELRTILLPSVAAIMGGIMSAAFDAPIGATIAWVAITPWITTFLMYPGPHRVRRVSAVLTFAVLVSAM